MKTAMLFIQPDDAAALAFAALFPMRASRANRASAFVYWKFIARHGSSRYDLSALSLLFIKLLIVMKPDPAQPVLRS